MGGNSFKRWSPSYTKSFVLTVAFIVLVAGLALYLVTAGLRCMDMNGCMREHCLCKWDRFPASYQALIRASMTDNPSCRLAIGDPALKC